MSPKALPKRHRALRQSTIAVALFLAIGLLVASSPNGLVASDVLRPAQSLEEQIKSLPAEKIARVARERGDAKRGSLIFHTSPAGCATCHLADNHRPALGPNLAASGPANDRHLVESLTHPSKVIRKGYETHQFLMNDGKTYSGNILKESETAIDLLPAEATQSIIRIDKEQIEARKKLNVSGMPEGLLSTFREQRDFMDLLKYLMVLYEEGEAAQKRLYPTPEQLSVQDDVSDLDHQTIIQKLRTRDFDTGKNIYQGYCFGCHGRDGNQPSLPTARAFGKDKMKFGSDPYSMFQTLSLGNGLMAPMTHLTPKERYQVIHYLREEFMKPNNPDYFSVTEGYLKTLPQGTRLGDERPEVLRDFRPALGSQLGREFESVLNVPLGAYSVAYDLHTMNIASLWGGEFVDVSETQHARDRGEGTVTPKGTKLPLLGQWKWSHQGTPDYPTDNLLPRGPLPSHWMKYHGYYRFQEQVVLSYEIDSRKILELPTSNPSGITQHLEIGPGEAIQVVIGGLPITAEIETTPANSNEKIKRIGQTEHVRLATDVAPAFLSTYGSANKDQSTTKICSAIIGDVSTDNVANCEIKVDSLNRLILNIPRNAATSRISLVRTIAENTNSVREASENLATICGQTTPLDLASRCGGSEAIWNEEIQTTGFLGLEQNGYAIDTLTIPETNPWHSWIRTSALDFFSDGRLAVSTYGGDVWIVSGIDDDLKNLRWKRYAAGLYEPFGLRIVSDQIYVTCKDRLVRLHDLDDDGEADFYENFSDEPDVSINFHAFSFDLQTDSEGNFYYAKSGHGSDSTLPGMIYKVSKDGKDREVFSTGFRTPNGLGMMPGDRLVGSDNQGQWMPASKINHLKPGKFYGWVPTYSIPGMWEPDGGNLDIKKVIPPTSFEPPIVWMPQDFDNSSGGQHYVEDDRFGPLSNHLLHTSFGKGWISYLMTQEINGQMQGAIIRLPLDFRTGVMRARTNPTDGQVYAAGLQGWNGGGRVGLRDNGLQRLRYTRTPATMITDCQVVSGGLELTFNQPIDENSCQAEGAFEIQHWNYHWRASYGSAQYRPSDDLEGVETLAPQSIQVSPDGKRVVLIMPNLIPVDQLHLRLNVTDGNGKSFEEEIYWTIHNTLK